jgi:phosphoglycerate dehydrogenase-like enzyme
MTACGRAEREAIDAERRKVEAERQAAERAEFERQAKIKAEQDAAEKVERDRLDKAKRDAEIAALAPDLEKIAAFVAGLRTMSLPKLKSAKLARFVSDAGVAISAAATALETAAKGGR